MSNLQTHRSWLGLLQREGVVLSAVALDEAGVVVEADVRAAQTALAEQLWDEVRGQLLDVWQFLTAGQEAGGLGWQPGQLLRLATPADAGEFALAIPGTAIVLAPDAVVLQRPAQRDSALLLVRVVADPHCDPDRALDRDDDGWTASHVERFEKLLRSNPAGVRAGVLVTPRELRLLHAPPGQMSGQLVWRLADLLQTAGRPMLAGLRAVLRGEVLHQSRGTASLPRLFERSREAQNAVTQELSLQVLDGLRALLAAFDAADQASHGKLLAGVTSAQLYQALLHVLLRLVFLLFAEERQLLPDDAVWRDGYGLRSLFDRLVDDEALHADALTLRYGAWARLLATFRMIHDGARWPQQRMPARAGVLFNPDNWPFLEGRPAGSSRQAGERLVPPNIPDAAVLAVLRGLLVVDGEVLSYRTLDVEHIGSVYEGMMGFTVEVATERSALVGKLGVPLALDPLLRARPADRVAKVRDAAQRMPAGVRTALQAATTAAELELALLPLCRQAGVKVVQQDGRYLMPTEERRRTGSHYTPRSLSAPIVTRTLQPLLADLGPHPRAAQLLALKICDPAVGSGAFLVETCRQLAEHVVAAWEHHNDLPPIPPDEEPLLYARRQVAERCLYGVDRNPVALDLAKLSLWLITLARDHDFTFVNHALKHGDSLVGLTLAQIRAFTWGEAKGTEGLGLFAQVPDRSVEDAAVLRGQLQVLGDAASYQHKQDLLRDAEDRLLAQKTRGDLIVAAFFSASKDADRLRELARLRRLADDIADGRARLAAGSDHARALREQDKPVAPLHWPLEFPEVFERTNPGFDAFVGNPPFAGKNNVIDGNAEGYLDWLKAIHPGAHGNADLSAHFFRRAFGLLRSGGTFGLIATNTISQGDTRSTGLRAIRQAGGHIYAATRRVRWPGLAAVVVSVVHVRRGPWRAPCVLDGRDVPVITAFLFHQGGDDDPVPLADNAGKSFQGSIVLGMGFTFDDSKPDATPIAEMHRLIAKDPRNAERIFPYLGGEEVNTSPTHRHHRYVINFGDMTEEQARHWPDLMAIVEAKVKPEREAQKDKGAKEKWWQFIRPRPELGAAIQGLERVLANSQVSTHPVFCFVPRAQVFSHALNVFGSGSIGLFAIVQSSCHTGWAGFLGSSMKDDLRYTPSDCFETFPFPDNWQTNADLEAIGERYYQFRAELMVRNQEGLTATYNRFHHPEETADDIAQLRALHQQMDRAVLDAYGWTDIPTDCDFFHVHEGIGWQERDAENPEHRARNFRYTWPEAVRDEVLARLLGLNAGRG